MRKDSRCKAVEKEIVAAFLSRESRDSTDFCVAIGRLERELRDLTDTPYADVPYDVVFDEKVLELLQEPAVKSDLDDFIARYDELISSSVYFKKGTFEYYNASTLARHLEDQGFFKARHFVTLNGKDKKEITSKAELESVIAVEKEKIASDPNLRARFDKVDSRLTANATLKAFREYILRNKAVLSKMTDVVNFKQEVWKSYLKVNEVLVEDLMSKYDVAKTENARILEEAKRESTDWEEVIRTFKDRFEVPVDLTVKNRDAIVGGDQEKAELTFSFKDADGPTPLQREALLDVLSQGEKKALYILDILFAIQVRRNSNQETLFIIDDIADSFDYRNKYAIIQYLMELSENPPFKMLILTHNFDFFRTVVSRFVGNEKCLVASRNGGEITIEKESNIDNIFIKEWKHRFSKDNKVRIASISFMRNLIEYHNSDQDPDFKTLTSLLHWKELTSELMQEDLNAIYNKLFSKDIALEVANERIIDVIHREAQDCLGVGVGINLERKIVLSIAIRLDAEKFMIERISDPAFVAGIKKNQTFELVRRFKNDFAGDTEAIRLLQKVLIMTPENIHLNAFMYEPILDMSDEHLRKLYGELVGLNAETAQTA